MLLYESSSGTLKPPLSSVGRMKPPHLIREFARPQVILLISDGPPSETPAQQDAIKDMVRARAHYNEGNRAVRIYSYGLGNAMARDVKNHALASVVCII